MRNCTIKIVSLFIMSMISGCTAMNSKFDCPMTQGVRCESIDQVNTRVDKNEFGSLPSSNSENSMPVWIAPYADQENNAHDDHYVHIRRSASQWKDTQHG